MDNFKKALDNRGSFILVVDDYKKADDVMYYHSISISPKTSYKVANSGPFHGFPRSAEKQPTSDQTIVVRAECSPLETKASKSMINDLKEIMTPIMNVGARSIIVFTTPNHKDSQPLILPFKNEQEFLAHLDKCVDLSDKIKSTRKNSTEVASTSDLKLR